MRFPREPLSNKPGAKVGYQGQTYKVLEVVQAGGIPVKMLPTREPYDVTTYVAQNLKNGAVRQIQCRFCTVLQTHDGKMINKEVSKDTSLFLYKPQDMVKWERKMPREKNRMVPHKGRVFELLDKWDSIAKTEYVKAWKRGEVEYGPAFSLYECQSPPKAHRSYFIVSEVDSKMHWVAETSIKGRSRA